MSLHKENSSVSVRECLRRISEISFSSSGPRVNQTVADALKEELRPGDLLIASSDNTHYGERFDYLPFPTDGNAADNLERLDMGAVERILALDLPGYADYKEETGITTCGYSGICVLLATLPPSATGTITG